MLFFVSDGCGVVGKDLSFECRVLGSLIGVMDHTGQRSTGEHVCVDRVNNELGSYVIRERPSDNASRVHVERGGQVAEPGPGRDIGDVSHP